MRPLLLQGRYLAYLTTLSGIFVAVNSNRRYFILGCRHLFCCLEGFFSGTELPVYGLLGNPYSYTRIPIRERGRLGSYRRELCVEAHTPRTRLYRYAASTVVASRYDAISWRLGIPLHQVPLLVRGQPRASERKRKRGRSEVGTRYGVFRPCLVGALG